MQKELEDILKFYDLIYLQYSTAFSIYQFILYLSSSASRISITVAFFVDWKTLAKCIFHDSHLAPISESIELSAMVPQVQGEGLPVFAWRGGRAADWLEITYPCPVGYDGQKQFSNRLRRGARWPKRTLREKTIPSVPPSGLGVRCLAGFAAPFALPARSSLCSALSICSSLWSSRATVFLSASWAPSFFLQWRYISFALVWPTANGAWNAEGAFSSVNDPLRLGSSLQETGAVENPPHPCSLRSLNSGARSGAPSNVVTRA